MVAPATGLITLKSAGVKLVTVPSAFAFLDIYPKERLIAKTLGVPKARSVLQSQITTLKFPKTSIKVAFLYMRATASIYLIGGLGSGADSILRADGFVDVGANNLKHAFNAFNAFNSK